VKDSHYTPEKLAQKLLSFVSTKNLRTIADFCVGNGALLESAQKTWTNATFYGSDISVKAISQLKRSQPHWNLSQCDFTNSKSRSHAKILNNSLNGFDLVLLNPPFSCRGSSSYIVDFEDKTYRVSTSMLFIVESLKYLSKKGFLLAILPISVAYSQKDRLIWNKLVADYKLNILEQPSVNLFKDCSPSVMLVSINTNGTKCVSRSQNCLNHSIPKISLFRGKISMYSLNGSSSNGNFLIHSTNLRNNKVVNLDYRISNKLSRISGPAVLLPRVGLPNPQKISIIKKGETYVLSDCIIGIRTSTNKDAKELLKLLLNYWEKFQELYKGTGAKYITLERLGAYLNIPEQQYTIPSLSGIIESPTKQIPHSKNSKKASNSSFAE
jgi:tRNA1(Val) A37 N6-methylase TrmN6